MSKLEFVCDGRVINMKQIGRERNWPEMVAKSLSNQVRWGGMEDDALSIAKHCVEVSKVVEDLTDSLELAYYALHHEVEEAFGVGDIIHDVKHYLFSKDKTQYNKFKGILAKQLNLEKIDHPEIKKGDLIVGFLEAERLYGQPPGEDFYTFADCTDIPTLVDKYRGFVQLNPQDRMKDRKEFLDRHYALKSLLDYENYRKFK